MAHGKCAALQAILNGLRESLAFGVKHFLLPRTKIGTYGQHAAAYILPCCTPIRRRDCEAGLVRFAALAEAMETSLSSLIDKTWVTLEFCNHGYDHVVNIATDVILGPDEPGYDHKKFNALLEEIKPYLRRYDRANVIGKEMRVDLRRAAL